VKALAVAVATLMVGVAVLAGLAGLVGSVLGSGGSAASLTGSVGTGVTGSVVAVSAAMLTLYQEAATTCPGLSWTVLAAIGTVESGNDTSTLPGVHSGSNAAGAEGPMQFEPATFAAYDQPTPPGGAIPPSPYDPTDAVYAAAQDLCANGGGSPATLSAAIFDYNHAGSYVDEVLALAQQLAVGVAGDGGGVIAAAGTAVSEATGLTAPSTVGTEAALWALAQVGTPYRWGGETPGVAFDCSGLVQAAYKAVGVTLPRVAQDQFDAGPHLAATAALEPGDLVFFGSGPGDVTHVGLVLSIGVMVDAPHTGADVRVEYFPTTVGAAFGSDRYVGATRPAPL
jgi:cell wall-associated NlpC family hydrolase